MKTLTRKQKLQNIVTEATAVFIKKGGKIKKLTIPTEVNFHILSFCDFMLMEDAQLQAV